MCTWSWGDQLQFPSALLTLSAGVVVWKTVLQPHAPKSKGRRVELQDADRKSSVLFCLVAWPLVQGLVCWEMHKDEYAISFKGRRKQMLLVSALLSYFESGLLLCVATSMLFSHLHAIFRLISIKNIWKHPLRKNIALNCCRSSVFTYFDLHIGRITAVLEKGWIYVLGAHNTSSQLPDFCYGNAYLNAERFPTSEECLLQWYFLSVTTGFSAYRWWSTNW